jgi:hypothetical protein
LYFYIFLYRYFLEPKSAKKAPVKKTSIDSSRQQVAEERKRAAEEQQKATLAVAEERKREAEEKKQAAKAAAEEKRKAATAVAEARKREAEEKKQAAIAVAEARKREAEEKKQVALAAANARKNVQQAKQTVEKAKTSGTISLGFFKFGQSDSEEKLQSSAIPSIPVRKVASAPKGVPTLYRWKQNRDGTISGAIFGSKSFKDGESITTSAISSKVGDNAVAQTTSGSK